MSLDSGLDAALQGYHVRGFVVLRIEFRLQTLNLLAGSGAVSFSVDGSTVVFTGRDALYGTLGAIDAVEEAVATSAPRVKITILPPSPTAIAALDDPLSQGARVRIWVGAVSEATGLVQGVPELLWTGFVDTTSTVVDNGTQSVAIDTASVFERLFMAGEAQRLNGSFHRQCYPGETGLDNVIAAVASPVWGTNAPKPVFAQYDLSPTLGDRLAGTNTGGKSDGQSVYTPPTG